MAFSEEIASKVPFGFLLYILASGLATVLMLPYDFFSITLSNGFDNLADYMIFLNFFGDNFFPFGNISYISTVSTTIDLTKFVFVILIVGIFFVLVRGFFSWANHFPYVIYLNIAKWKKELEPYSKKEKLKVFSKKVKPWLYKKIDEFKALFFSSKKKVQRPTEDEEVIISNINFAKWARQKKYKPYLDYIWSIEEITLGLLHASEFLLLILIFVSLPQIMRAYGQNINSWLGMLIFSSSVWFFCLWIYKVNRRKHEKELEPFKKMFKKDEMWAQFD